jgi:hypothetical protein
MQDALHVVIVRAPAHDPHEPQTLPIWNLRNLSTRHPTDRHARLGMYKNDIAAARASFACAAR